MTDTTKDFKDYLGDGVYVDFDGYQIEMMANDPRIPTDTIYLDPTVMLNLVKYAKRIGLLEQP